MNSDQELGEKLESSNRFRRLYDLYAAGIAYVSVVNEKGDEQIGSCFHIGDGIFVTARHVVEGVRIKEIATTVGQREYYALPDTLESGFARVRFPYNATASTKFQGPYFHPDSNIDVALLVVPDIKAPILPLGDHLDDWLGNEMILSNVVIFGYPPIPFSREPLLITTKCEVNAIVDKYTGGHPHFILSTMARGGFSGGPAITEDGVVLGVITESLNTDYKPTELGYLSVLSVEGIYNCIAHHRLVPDHLDKLWDGFWNTESANFSDSASEHVTISFYRGKNEFYFTIFSYRPDVILHSIEIFDAEIHGFYSLHWVHDQLIKVEFKPSSLSETHGATIYAKLINMADGLGLARFPKSIS